MNQCLEHFQYIPLKVESFGALGRQCERSRTFALFMIPYRINNPNFFLYVHCPCSYDYLKP